jgi:hypothetical protein
MVGSRLNELVGYKGEENKNIKGFLSVTEFVV